MNIKVTILALAAFLFPFAQAYAEIYGKYFEEITVKPKVKASNYKGLALVNRVKNGSDSYQLNISPLKGQCDNNGYCELVGMSQIKSASLTVNKQNNAKETDSARELRIAADILGGETELVNRLIWVDAKRQSGSWQAKSLKVIRESSREHFDKVVQYGKDYERGEDLIYYVLHPEYGFLKQYDLDWSSLN